MKIFCGLGENIQGNKTKVDNNWNISLYSGSEWVIDKNLEINHMFFITVWDNMTSNDDANILRRQNLIVMAY